jgi:hypothetical protein
VPFCGFFSVTSATEVNHLLGEILKALEILRVLPGNFYRLTMGFHDLVDVSRIPTTECHYEWESRTASEGTHGSVSFCNTSHAQGQLAKAVAG